MKKCFLIIIILLTALTGFFIYRVKLKSVWENLTRERLPQAVEYRTKDAESSIPSKSLTNEAMQATDSLAVGYENLPKPGSPAVDSEQLPKTYNLNVPFTPQAPLADWDETFKEACEEASALTVHYYYQNKTFTPPLATAEIIKMVDWQLSNFGGHFDLTASQTAQMIKGYWGYKKVEIIDNPTIEQIKYQISQGRPVIVPAAGRLLGNPYFRQPGPIYHMLVIKGYTEKKFITNDPGTRRGADFLYNYQTVIETMHDWNPEDILLGGKRIIVIYPNN